MLRNSHEVTTEVWVLGLKSKPTIPGVQVSRRESESSEMIPTITPAVDRTTPTPGTCMIGRSQCTTAFAMRLLVPRPPPRGTGPHGLGPIEVIVATGTSKRVAIMLVQTTNAQRTLSWLATAPMTNDRSHLSTHAFPLKLIGHRGAIVFHLMNLAQGSGAAMTMIHGLGPITPTLLELPVRKRLLQPLRQLRQLPSNYEVLGLWECVTVNLGVPLPCGHRKNLPRYESPALNWKEGWMGPRTLPQCMTLTGDIGEAVLPRQHRSRRTERRHGPEATTRMLLGMTCRHTVGNMPTDRFHATFPPSRTQSWRQP
eukprot:Rmarinus@m.9280